MRLPWRNQLSGVQFNLENIMNIETPIYGNGNTHVPAMAVSLGSELWGPCIILDSVVIDGEGAR